MPTTKTPPPETAGEGYRFLDEDEIMDCDYIAIHEIDKWIDGHWFNKVWPRDSNGTYRTQLSRRDLHFRMGRPIETAPQSDSPCVWIPAPKWPLDASDWLVCGCADCIAKFNSIEATTTLRK